MPRLDKYPYKYMKPIINILNSEGVTLKEIKTASGACTPDSVEVMHMLKFITSHGIVKSENNLYFLKNSDQKTISRPKRYKLIHELLLLLEGLSENPESLSTISERVNWHDLTDLKRYLDFLCFLTAKGQIQGNISLIGRLSGRGNWSIN